MLLRGQELGGQRGAGGRPSTASETAVADARTALSSPISSDLGLTAADRTAAERELSLAGKSLEQARAALATVTGTACLTAAGEQSAGSCAVDPDTDGDGIDDSQEADHRTDPLPADTDD